MIAGIARIYDMLNDPRKAFQMYKQVLYFDNNSIESIASAASIESIKSTIYAQGKQRGYSTTTATPEPSPLGLGILKRKYNRRWWMLFVSCLLNVANSCVWIAVPTVQNLLAQQYNVEQHAIVQLTNIAYLLYLPGSIIGFYILEKGGVSNIYILPF